MTRPPSAPEPEDLELVAETKPEFAALMRRAALRAGYKTASEVCAATGLKLGTCYRYLHEGTTAFPMRQQVLPWFRGCGFTEAQLGAVLKLWQGLHTSSKPAEAPRTGSAAPIGTPSESDPELSSVSVPNGLSAPAAVHHPQPSPPRRNFVFGVLNAVVLLACSIALGFLPYASMYFPYTSDLYRIEAVILRATAVGAVPIVVFVWWLARRRHWPIKRLTSWPTVIVLAYAVTSTIAVWSMVCNWVQLRFPSHYTLIAVELGANAGLLFGLLVMVILTIGVQVINVHAAWELSRQHPLIAAAPILVGTAWTALMSIRYYYTLFVAAMIGTLVAAAVLLLLEKSCARTLRPAVLAIEQTPVGTDRPTDLVPTLTMVNKARGKARAGATALQLVPYSSTEEDTVAAFCADLASLRENHPDRLSFREMEELSAEWDPPYRKTALCAAVNPAKGLPTEQLVRVFVGILTGGDSDEIRRWTRRREALAAKIAPVAKPDASDGDVA